MLNDRALRDLDSSLAGAGVAAPTDYQLRRQVFQSLTDIKIEIDHDKSVGYNSRFFVRHFINWWFAFIARILPKKMVSKVFRGTSHHIDQIVQYRKSWQALKLIYNWGRPETKVPSQMLRMEKEKHYWNQLWANFWETMVVYGAGTRNRFLQVKKLTRSQMAVTNPDRPFRILSIGSGSSQALLEAIWEERKLNPNREVRLYALDMSKAGLKECVHLASCLGIPSDMIFTQQCLIARISDLAKKIADREFDLIEVVGFSEYQETPWLIELSRVLFEHLAPSGILLLNNARPNREAWFTREIMQWPLNLKEPETLAEIMVSAGFTPRNVSIIGEPTKTFWMAKAIKESA